VEKAIQCEYVLPHTCVRANNGTGIGMYEGQELKIKEFLDFDPENNDAPNVYGFLHGSNQEKETRKGISKEAYHVKMKDIRYNEYEYDVVLKSVASSYAHEEFYQQNSISMISKKFYDENSKSPSTHFFDYVAPVLIKSGSRTYFVEPYMKFFQKENIFRMKYEKYEEDLRLFFGFVRKTSRYKMISDISDAQGFCKVDDIISYGLIGTHYLMSDARVETKMGARWNPDSIDYSNIKGKNIAQNTTDDLLSKNLAPRNLFSMNFEDQKSILNEASSTGYDFHGERIPEPPEIPEINIKQQGINFFPRNSFQNLKNRSLIDSDLPVKPKLFRFSKK
jgi:hypothetical protein